MQSFTCVVAMTCQNKMNETIQQKSRWHKDFSELKLEQVLLKSKIQKTVSLKEHLESKGFEYDAASHVYLVDMGNGVFAVKRDNGNEEGVAEVSAYQLNNFLGLDLVPPTVQRKIDGKWYTLQFFVEGNPKLMSEKTTLSDIQSAVSKKDFSDMNIFSFVIGQYDNHKNNMLVDKNNRLTMFDFEVIRIIQHVQYGGFPFLRRGNWVDVKTNLDGLNSFPFDKFSTLNDPTLEELREVFSPYWAESLILSFYKYIRYMPNKELNYVRWRGFIWVQNKISSRRVAVTDYTENPSLKGLDNLSLKKLEAIFSKPVFQKRHIELILQRATILKNALKK